MLRLDLSFLGRLVNRRRALTKGAAVVLGALVLVTGAGQGIDRMLRLARDDLRAHPASGEVQIVEIDERSLQAIDRWPYPRRYHAQLIDRLEAAGVRSIAFDVDFSSLSNPVDDGALAASLRRAGGGVILPTLRQQESSQSSRYVDNIPAKLFRENAFLASVNVRPDSDGNVRQMLLGLTTGGVPRPSLATMVAERQAEIDRSFDVDYSIDPDSIPRHSFIDVIGGRVPASELRGKRIIVGSTAVEIWDRYSVPNHGVIPGVVIQALAAETLLNGPVPSSTSGLWALLLALALIAATIRPGNPTRRMLGFGAGTAAILALPLAGEQWFALTFPIAPAVAALSLASALALLFHFVGRFRSPITQPACRTSPRCRLRLRKGRRSSWPASTASPPSPPDSARARRSTSYTGSPTGSASVTAAPSIGSTRRVSPGSRNRTTPRP
jgi:CHASE2 domain-containing sensor protein